MSKNSNATRVQPKYCSVKVCSASHIKCTEGEIFLKMYFQETVGLKHFIPHPTFFVSLPGAKWDSYWTSRFHYISNGILNCSFLLALSLSSVPPVPISNGISSYHSYPLSWLLKVLWVRIRLSILPDHGFSLLKAPSFTAHVVTPQHLATQFVGNIWRCSDDLAPNRHLVMHHRLSFFFSFSDF
jgi:hypothetical protein